MTDRRAMPAHSLVIPVTLAVTLGLLSCGSPATVPEATVLEATIPEATASPADVDVAVDEDADADEDEPRGLRVTTPRASPGGSCSSTHSCRTRPTSWTSKVV